jgi:hypothetical protein
MPTHRPPLPPKLSPIHATGSTYAYSVSDYPLDMPEELDFNGQQSRSFNMDDEEDLYGDQPDTDGKFVESGQKHENCVVQ